MSKRRYADLVDVTGVPEEVRVGDIIKIEVMAAFQNDFIKGADVFLNIKPVEPDAGAAYILEAPDISGISIPDEHMGGELPRETAEFIDDVLTMHSSEKTNDKGEAFFRIRFAEPGDVLITVSWYDANLEELCTEEYGVQIFKSGAPLVYKEQSIIEEVEETDTEEGRRLDELKLEELSEVAISSEEPDSEPDHDLTLDEEVPDDYEESDEPLPAPPEEPGEDSLDFSSEVLIDEATGESDEEVLMPSEDDRPVTKLEAEIKTPELTVGGEGEVEIKVKSTWGGQPAKSVTVESVSDKLELSLPHRITATPRIVEGLTDEKGVYTCFVKHVGRISEKLALVVSWGDVGEQHRSEEVELFISPRNLTCDIAAPKKVEVGGEFKVCVQVHQRGSAVAGVPVRVRTEDDDLMVMRLDRHTQEPLDSEHADTDKDGRIDFLVKHVGKDPATSYYTVEWSSDGVPNMQDKKVKAFRKEEKPMEGDKEEEKKDEKTDEKKDSEKPAKKSRTWLLWAGVGLILLVAAFGVTFLVASQSGNKSKKGKPAPPAMASLDEPEAKSDDVPLSATTEGEEESEPVEVATTADDMAFSVEEAEASETEEGSEEPPPEDPEATDMVIPLDAHTVQWDANDRKIRIVSKELNLEFTEAKQSKLKLKKAQDKLGNLEDKLGEAKQTNTSLTMENGDLEDQINNLKKEIGKLESGVPNLDLIRVDKIECSGEVDKKTKKGKVVAIEIPECDVYLSIVSKKK
ncbi:MAG: hypothetical protein GWN55_16320 [Phycisphaerae bacterium]|nr:hypothetical protein [Phycisphaerae bacterium]NIS16956.1 hypothetical protein [candidate division Zixibacteria bacterium]NIS27995.1 hypothetical protein [candidate division KSB1 bacterium]NIU28648.1 hypothetical protein [candidate division KSB1 bacterium]NIV02860.1 hypothetical protein [Phycisphaerae bacterium]